MLSAGHLYRVRFNDEQGNPRLVDAIEEFPRESYTYDDYKKGAPGPWDVDESRGQDGELSQLGAVRVTVLRDPVLGAPVGRDKFQHGTTRDSL